MVLRKGRQNLDEESDGEGLEHIIYRHHNKNNPKGGTQWPEHYTKEDIIEKINLAIKEGELEAPNSRYPMNRKVVLKNIKLNENPEIKGVVVIFDSKTGEIITSHPNSGLKVEDLTN